MFSFILVEALSLGHCWGWTSSFKRVLSELNGGFGVVEYLGRAVWRVMVGVVLKNLAFRRLCSAADINTAEPISQITPSEVKEPKLI